MRWNRVRLAAAAAALVALAAGCSTSSGSSASGNSPASAGTPKKGGTLTIIYQNEVTSLDPTATTTAAEPAPCRTTRSMTRCSPSARAPGR